jgi:hypothetical protein
MLLEYPIKKWCRLENSLVPKVFEVINDELYFFDNINKHEGRFCKKNGFADIILDVDVPFGIFTHDNMYSIDMGKNTIIKEFDLDGNFVREFLLYGTFYDFAKDDSGNFIFLGLVDRKSCVEIYNKNGIKINSFEILKVVLGYGIYIDRNYLYIGGVDEPDIIKLLQINYMGVTVNEWLVYNPSRTKTIDKILGCGNYLILLFRGETNNIVILNKINEKKTEIFPEEMGLEEFVDIAIYNEMIYILNHKDIYVMPINNILYHIPQKKIKKIRMYINGFSYTYMMYSLEFYESFLIVVKLAIIIDVIFYTFVFLSKNHIFEIDTRIIISGISLCYFAPYLISILYGINQLSRRGKRIDRLIEINDYDNLKWIGGQILIALLVSFIITLIFPINFPRIILCLISLLILSIYIGSIFANNIIALKKDMIVELLYEENIEIIEYIKTILTKMKENNVDDIYINVIAENISFKDIIENWSNSRRCILKQDVLIKIRDEKITTVIDLSKRDIRYSKQSILMDYICYVKGKIDIKEIELFYYDLKNEL